MPQQANTLAMNNEKKAPNVIHAALPNSAVVKSRYLFRARAKRDISMTKAMKVIVPAKNEDRVMRTVPER